MPFGGIIKTFGLRTGTVPVRNPNGNTNYQPRMAIALPLWGWLYGCGLDVAEGQLVFVLRLVYDDGVALTCLL